MSVGINEEKPPERLFVEGFCRLCFPNDKRIHDDYLEFLNDEDIYLNGLPVRTSTTQDHGNGFFICSSELDIEFAKELRRELMSNFYLVSMSHGLYNDDDNNDYNDHDYKMYELIEDSIITADVIILILTKNILHSKDKVLNELKIAKKYNKLIFPLIYNNDDDIDYGIKINKDWFIRINGPELDMQLIPEIVKEIHNKVSKEMALIRVHTKLLLLALCWDFSIFNNDYLLKKNDIIRAKNWIQFRNDKGPIPTLLHLSFIEESIKFHKTKIKKRLITFIAILLLFVGILHSGPSSYYLLYIILYTLYIFN